MEGVASTFGNYIAREASEASEHKVANGRAGLNTAYPVSLTIVGYAGVAAIGVLVYTFFSSGDLSFLMTVSSLVSLSSFIMVAICIECSRSCRGLSVGMLQCYMFVQIGRLAAIVPFEGYLPYDATGDWLYQCLECCTALTCGFSIYLCKIKFLPTYDAEVDRFNILYLIIPCALFASIFHPDLNEFAPCDISWAFAFYLETFSSLPQLFMFQREKTVYPWTAHFLAAQAMVKLVTFLFWFWTYVELETDDESTGAYVGYWVFGCQGMQLLFMGDFLIQYVRCMSTGKDIKLLISDIGV